jgi:DNA invertase Pin-like site-specific DNA recombinase
VGSWRQDDPEDPMRTFARQVMGAAAQLERGLVTARLQAGRKRKAAGGGYVGGQRTFGYRIEERRLVRVPEEQAVIRRIRGWARRGWSLRRIAARLNEEGVPTANGGRWGVSQLHYLLKR